MPTHTSTIDDIHGCSAALVVLLDAIPACRENTTVTLGDHIIPGPDKSGAHVAQRSGR
jgi:hypothetical protein